MVNGKAVKLVDKLLRMLRVLLLLALPLPLLLLTRSTPLDLSPPSPVTSAAPHQRTEPRDLAWYAPLWERDWQARLTPEPIAPPPTPPPKQVPALCATFVEPKTAYAHLRGQDGILRLHGVGETVDDFRLAAIEQGRVRLEHGDQSYWIAVPKEDSP